MALTSKSSFLYNLQVTASNSSLDFKISGGGSQLNATLTQGFYSLSGLMEEIVRALQAADPSHTYTVTADRTVSSGTQNRVTISTNGAFLGLLFATGTRSASTCAPLIGFAVSDRTGATTYTGTASAGTILLTTWYASSYLPPESFRKVFGSLNVSATGEKESIVYQVQKFFQAEFKYEPQAYVISDWAPFLTWAIQQRDFEFTPQISSPNTVLDCSLEKTSADGKGLGYTMKEMLPEMPFLFTTGLLTFRLKET